jgi:hypothetical protein
MLKLKNLLSLVHKWSNINVLVLVSLFELPYR